MLKVERLTSANTPTTLNRTVAWRYEKKYDWTTFTDSWHLAFDAECFYLELATNVKRLTYGLLTAKLPLTHAALAPLLPELPTFDPANTGLVMPLAYDSPATLTAMVEAVAAPLRKPLSTYDLQTHKWQPRQGLSLMEARYQLRLFGDLTMQLAASSTSLPTPPADWTEWHGDSQRTH